MEQETQTPHKRRVRYKGKYPRKFEEKYKELNPEKYKDVCRPEIIRECTACKARGMCRIVSGSFISYSSLYG